MSSATRPLSCRPPCTTDSTALTNRDCAATTSMASTARAGNNHFMPVIMPCYDWRMTTATFDTSEGTFKVKLFDDKAPNTVANFVGLAEGTKEWTDPKTGQKVKRPFYDGLVFHRVIEGFMIQGGCPMGNGMGGPGYRFANAF